MLRSFLRSRSHSSLGKILETPRLEPPRPRTHSNKPEVGAGPASKQKPEVGAVPAEQTEIGAAPASRKPRSELPRPRKPHGRSRSGLENPKHKVERKMNVKTPTPNRLIHHATQQRSNAAAIT